MNQILFSVIAGFAGGIAIASVSQNIFLHTQTFLIIGCSIFFFALIFQIIMQRKVFILLALFFISAFCFGLARMGYVVMGDSTQQLASFTDQTVTIEGIVARDPDIRIDNQKVVVGVERIIPKSTRPNNHVLVHDVNILVTLDRYTAVQYGDLVMVTGKLVPPENFVTDTGREFDYENYLAKDDIFYQIFQPTFEILDNGYGKKITYWMLSLKHTLLNVIHKILPAPESSLLAGELLGEKSALDGDLKTDFRRTGVIHIVVLSGFNISIVAIFIMWLLERFLHPRIALFISIVSIVLFAMLVGGGATVIRASIMAILATVARIIGRDYDVTRALFFAGFFMILQNPKILVFDISFQLSFLATLSLIYISPLLEKKLGWVSDQFKLRETLVQTLSAQLFVLPLLIYSIGEFSIVSILVNVLVVPLVPFAMLFGFITALVGLVLPILTIIPMVPTYVLLKLQLVIVGWFSSLSFATIHIPQIPTWLVLVLYGTIGVWVMRQYYKKMYSQSVDASSQ